jgi:hypothetical protein
MQTKQRLTIYADKELHKKLKIRAIEEERNVSEITEQLWREYLDRSKSQPRGG